MPRTPRISQVWTTRQRSRGRAVVYVALALGANGAWASRAAAQEPAPPASNPPPPTQPAPAPRGPLMGPSEPPPSGVPTIDVRKDQDELRAQGAQRASTDGTIASKPGDIFSEDWWGRARPMLEIHGYFRTRGELFHNFALGRHDTPDTAIWPHPLDQSYQHVAQAQSTSVDLCGPNGNQACYDKTSSTANMRFRINPELHISDNLRILSQIDLLDNLVLGSTPESLFRPNPDTPNAYAPTSFFSTTQGVPNDSVRVKRAWAEYQTPVGQLRFGRMPDHWGLGMVYNAGDTIDSDYQSTIDRIMFTTGIKSMDLYAGGTWDFMATGPIREQQNPHVGGQPYNNCNLCNVDQWSLFVAHKTNPEIQRYKLAHGDFVLNGGIYTKYRKQLLDVQFDTNPLFPAEPGLQNNGLERRKAWMLIPDVWIQALWNKFRFEAEAAAYYGSIGNLGEAFNGAGVATDIRSFAVATQTEYRAVEDKLRLQFGFGWASGDPWDRSLDPSANPQANHIDPSAPLRTFRYHQDYRVDLIFFRRLLTRVEGAYYFRPSVDYDFTRNANGQRFGGGAAIIWGRASEFIQTPGHKRDLGVELDLQLYYQAKDGSLNDDPEKLGGFYAMLQYGVFFPLGGLEYLPGTQAANPGLNWDLSTAQTVRLFLGVAY